MVVWYQELTARGDGPDYFTTLDFDEAAAGQLEAFVRSVTLEGFSYLRVTPGLNAASEVETGVEEGRSYDLYVDEYHFRQVADNIRGKDPKNVWIYTAIEVEGERLTIHRGNGGSTDGRVETELLRRAATESEFSLRRWRIGATNHDSRVVAEGDTAEGLLAYLDGQK